MHAFELNLGTCSQSGLFEDSPLGTIGLVYLYRVANISTGGAKLTLMSFLSTASSWMMLGVRRPHLMCSLQACGPGETVEAAAAQGAV